MRRHLTIALVGCAGAAGLIGGLAGIGSLLAAAAGTPELQHHIAGSIMIVLGALSIIIGCPREPRR